MMEPTNEELAKLCDEWADGMPNDLALAKEWRLISARLRAQDIPPGHVIDDKGVVRKVLGTLHLTADKCIACQDAVVWHPTNGACYPVLDGLNMAAKVYGGSTLVPASECYSTREAAEAARKGTEG